MLLKSQFARVVGVTLLSVVAAGCTAHTALVARDAGGVGPAWVEPAWAPDRLTLETWRTQVGVPLVVSGDAARLADPSQTLTVVSWNTAVGDADIVRFVADLRQRIGGHAPVVFLLQEVYRDGLPRSPLPVASAGFAGRLGAARTDRSQDIEAVARATGLSLYYAPSMRNGSPLDSDEDRGNAMLSNIPLTGLTAIELPFERQRRVALAANVGGTLDTGEAWTLRLVCVHLDNMVGLRKFWVAGSELARARQARALVDYVGPEGAGVMAGDFNTWFGFSDRAYVEAARAFPLWPPTDRRATFRGLLRLDHMFFRLPDGWQASYRRADDRYGSDHSPLVATLTLPSVATAH